MIIAGGLVIIGRRIHPQEGDIVEDFLMKMFFLMLVLTLLVGGCGALTPTQSVQLAPMAPTRDSQYVHPTIASNPQSKWYVGGKLHGSTVEKWNNATYANRLATSADFLSAYMNDNGIPFSGIDNLKQPAVSLEKCISNLAEEMGTNEKVAFLSVICNMEMLD